jgi:hypothetical protein
MAASVVGTVCFTALPVIFLLNCLIIYHGEITGMKIMNTIIKTIGVGTMALVGLPEQTVPTMIRCSILKKTGV